MKLFSTLIDPETTINSFTGGSHNKKLNDLEAKWSDSPTGHQLNQAWDKKIYGETPQKDATND